MRDGGLIPGVCRPDFSLSRRRSCLGAFGIPNLVRVRLRDGETEVRIRDPKTFEDVVRVRLRDQGDEVRVRNAVTEDDLVRLRDAAPGTVFVVDGIRVEITEDGVLVDVDDLRVSADEISVDATDDSALVQVGPIVVDPQIVILRVGRDGVPEDVVAVTLRGDQTIVLAR